MLRFEIGVDMVMLERKFEDLAEGAEFVFEGKRCVKAFSVEINDFVGVSSYGDVVIVGSGDVFLDDAVWNPSYYNSGKIEVIDFIEDQKLGFHLGNAIKYICRAGKKDSLKLEEDLRKAIWYVERHLKNLT
jgi:hypothetical protein